MGQNDLCLGAHTAHGVWVWCVVCGCGSGYGCGYQKAREFSVISDLFKAVCILACEERIAKH